MSTSWEPVTISSVVEGDGEVKALPGLLHRIAAELGIVSLRTQMPIREPRGNMTRAGGIERIADAAARRVKGRGGVLVLLDADDDCPAQFGPELLARARGARPDKRVAVVLANREYEAWFLAAAPSLAGRHGFAAGFPPVAAPEKPRDCKRLLSEARPRERPYKETVDQKLLTGIFDMKMARENSDSFDKFYRDVSWLLGAE